MYDGANLYRKLELRLDGGETRDVKVPATCEVPRGRRPGHESAGADPQRS
jgi:hypothetical protein